MKRAFLCIFMIFVNLFDKVFAVAYLEGDEALNESKSFLDGLDSNMIMANWYKIVLIVVGVLCVIGLIVGNVKWFRNRRNKK